MKLINLIPIKEEVDVNAAVELTEDGKQALTALQDVMTDSEFWADEPLTMAFLDDFLEDETGEFRNKIVKGLIDAGWAKQTN